MCDKIEIKNGEKIVGSVANGGIGFQTVQNYNRYFTDNQYIKLEKYKDNFTNKFLTKAFSIPILIVVLFFSIFYKNTLDNELLSIGIQNEKNISLEFIGGFFLSYLILIILISVIFAFLEVFRDKLYKVIGDKYLINLSGVYEKNKPIFIFDDIVNIRAVNNSIVAYSKSDISNDIVLRFQNDYDTFKVIDMWETYRFNKQKEQDKATD